MCQLTLCDLKNDNLNRRMFTLLSTVGSTVHKDGWGVSVQGGDYYKCDLPAYYTSNLGILLRGTEAKEKDKPLMGHIRFASPKVPVTIKNSHPFVSHADETNFVFMHNGKLEPKEEKDFTMEEEVVVEKEDSKTHEITKVKEKVSVSDSKLFFSQFIKEYKSVSKPEGETDDVFVTALNKTVDKFYGKFAFIFQNVNTKTFYVVRGKSADLYISYMMSSSRKDAKSIGYIINTDNSLLDKICILLSNLNQVDGGDELFFSTPEKLKDNTIYKALEFGLMEIGETKETEHSYTNFTRYGRNMYDYEDTPNYSLSDLEKHTKAVLSFMEEFSLKISDIQNLFLALYGISLLEASEPVIKHFSNKVIPRLSSISMKGFRKRISSISSGWITVSDYEGYEYPWMLNEKNAIESFTKKLEKTHKDKAAG